MKNYTPRALIGLGLWLGLLNVAAGPTPIVDSPTGGAVTLTVNVAAQRHAISPGIYGLHYNFISPSTHTYNTAFAQEIDLPVRRWGGNDTSRYNWTINLTNNGSDYFFENNTTSAETADEYIANGRATGTQTILTMPLMGWVAKNDTDACGYSLNTYTYIPQPYPYGSLPAFDPYRTHCGSGIITYTNGDQSLPLYYTPTLATDTSLAITEAFASAWVNHLVTQFGTAANGGVAYYSLDNEPDLWNSTHRDVHPDASTYDELFARAITYSQAIKAADPSGQILGPVSFGWSGYFFSAYDLEVAAQNGYTFFPDYAAHNNTYFLEWYLSQMHAYQQQHGQRLLDYLDIHFYPQNGVGLTSAGITTTQALRLRSTRALWDPTYQDESWIAQAGPDNGIVRLIPRMKEWIATHYPGTKLAITEYNWGALDHLNGALTQADILGIFGREGVDIANLFDTPYGSGGRFTSTSPGAYAFRMYRNYDGNGNKFGDTSVSATSTLTDSLSVHAAQRLSDGALTLMVVNKTSNPLMGDVSLAGFNPVSLAEVYRYSAANLNAIQPLAAQAVTPSGFTASFPANSITLVVIPTADSWARLYLPMIQK